jgi:hypothetical protein
VDKENMAHRHSGLLFSHKKNDLRSLAGKWMELEIIRLNKRSQAQQDKYHAFSPIYGI